MIHHRCCSFSWLSGQPAHYSTGVRVRVSCARVCACISAPSHVCPRILCTGVCLRKRPFPCVSAYAVHRRVSAYAPLTYVSGLVRVDGSQVSPHTDKCATHTCGVDAQPAANTDAGIETHTCNHNSTHTCAHGHTDPPTLPLTHTRMHSFT